MTSETLALTTVDGIALRADLAVPADHWAAVVLTHPHPLYGGDRHALVTDALFRALPPAGVATLRFDFRGAGDSEGEHDGGHGERLDVAAAIEALAPLAEATRPAGHVPLVVCGYSFGADVALCVTDPRLDAWVLVAPPLAAVPLGDMTAAGDHRPKLLVVPEHDQFRSPAAAAAATAAWRATSIITIPMGDHFLAGRTAAVAETIVGFLRSLAGR